VRVAGVDGTRHGWVAIELDDGAFVGARLLERIACDFGELDAAVVGVDVPIGFGPRDADSCARRFLGGAASTVFPTPSRELLERPFAPGLGISKQSHSLGPRVLHVTALAQRDPRIHEVHPEVSFRAMNSGRPLRCGKKTAGGVLERLQLLAGHGITLGYVGTAGSAPVDDVLDAAAAAWSANRVALGTACSLPDPPEELNGRSVAIWY
jgi:predicted RNase H-like nuclease